VIRLLLFLLFAAALSAFAYWVYARAEPPVRGTRRLAGLRALSLVLLLALLFDPMVPWLGGRGPDAPWALLDISLSMTAGDAAAWEAARSRADELAAEGWLVVPFGGGDSARGGGNAAVGLRSELGPSLVRAAEAGAGPVRVLSDLRFQDPVAAKAALASTAAPVAFEGFGESLANAGISAFTVADQVRRNDPVTAEVEFFSVGVSDSLVLEVREEGRLVASEVRATPAPGLRIRLPLELAPAAEAGRRRYTVKVRAPGDAFPSDDEGVTYMTAGHEAGGLVVVSLRPDWEPRSLLAVLDEATGLEASGFLRVGPDRFAPMGSALQRGSPVDSATVRAAVVDAALVALHGLDGGSDPWGRSLAGLPGRALIWPLDARGAEMVGFPSGPVRIGEWYASSDVPASALAADLAGARLEDLPPVGNVLPLSEGQAGIAPLLLRLRGSGPGEPGLVLNRVAGRRRAVVLASGFWRWAARDGAGKDAYRRLWSGVAGWLLASDAGAVSGVVRPDRWVVPRGEAVSWRVPGEVGDSVRLEIRLHSDSDSDSDSSAVFEGDIAGGGSATTGVLPPGTYAYHALSVDGMEHEGRFDVESRTLEMLPVPEVPDAAEGEAVRQVRGTLGRPLRTLPWPYLLLLTSLCVEWIARRRVGLR
jgi:hypothetical protein